MEAKMKHLQQVLRNKEAEDAWKQAKLHAKVFQRWLQTAFPALLADRCISVFKDLSKSAKKNYEAAVKDMYLTKAFERPVWIPPLWTPDNALTTQWLAVKPFSGGGVPRSIRCGEPFEAIIDREAPQPFNARNGPDMLLKLLEKCVPCARKIFSGHTSPMKLLHMNDYVIEKTFVFAVISLSKWLGKEWFSHGVFGDWPPIAPHDLFGGASDVVPLSFSSGSSGAAPAASSGLPAITTESDSTIMHG